jgi:hypothetical protein
MGAANLKELQTYYNKRSANEQETIQNDIIFDIINEAQEEKPILINKKLWKKLNLLINKNTEKENVFDIISQYIKTPIGKIHLAQKLLQKEKSSNDINQQLEQLHYFKKNASLLKETDLILKNLAKQEKKIFSFIQKPKTIHKIIRENVCKIQEKESQEDAKKQPQKTFLGSAKQHILYATAYWLWISFMCQNPKWLGPFDLLEIYFKLTVNYFLNEFIQKQLFKNYKPSYFRSKLISHLLLLLRPVPGTPNIVPNFDGTWFNKIPGSGVGKTVIHNIIQYIPIDGTWAKAIFNKIPYQNIVMRFANLVIKNEINITGLFTPLQFIRSCFNNNKNEKKYLQASKEITNTNMHHMLKAIKKTFEQIEKLYKLYKDDDILNTKIKNIKNLFDNNAALKNCLEDAFDEKQIQLFDNNYSPAVYQKMISSFSQITHSLKNYSEDASNKDKALLFDTLYNRIIQPEDEFSKTYQSSFFKALIDTAELDILTNLAKLTNQNTDGFSIIKINNTEIKKKDPKYKLPKDPKLTALFNVISDPVLNNQEKEKKLLRMEKKALTIILSLNLGIAPLYNLTINLPLLQKRWNQMCKFYSKQQETNNNLQENNSNKTFNQQRKEQKLLTHELKKILEDPQNQAQFIALMQEFSKGIQ